MPHSIHGWFTTILKILHTSDWHLGQNFYTKSRKAEHSAFLTWLLATIEEQSIDTVIVAGDVFDTGAPPSYARELYNQFCVDLHHTGCNLVVLGGNHDSVAMLNESKPLLAQLTTQVVAGVLDDTAEQAMALWTRAGQVGAILCAIPFIRPRDVMKSHANESAEDKRMALSVAIQRHYDEVYQSALALRETCDAKVPIIATGHLTAIGASSSDSVRDIYIGTLGGFSAEGFPPADYIALGHIHRPQKVAKKDHIRYSGSPIHLSFDELGQQKQVVIVEFTQNKPPLITPCLVPQFQPMAAIKGDLDKIYSELDALKSAVAGGTPLWLSIEVESQDYLTDLQQRVHTMIADSPIEVLQLTRARAQYQSSLHAHAKQTLQELTPMDVFEKRLAEESLDDEPERQQRLKQRFSAIAASIESEQSEAPE